MADMSLRLYGFMHFSFFLFFFHFLPYFYLFFPYIGDLLVGNPLFHHPHHQKLRKMSRKRLNSHTNLVIAEHQLNEGDWAEPWWVGPAGGSLSHVTIRCRPSALGGFAVWQRFCSLSRRKRDGSVTPHCPSLTVAVASNSIGESPYGRRCLMWMQRMCARPTGGRPLVFLCLA